MDSHTHSPQIGRLEVVDTGRRRRWTEDEKLKIVLESLRAPRQVSATARRYGISRSLLLQWRRSFRVDQKGAAEQQIGFVPAMVVPQSQRWPMGGSDDSVAGGRAGVACDRAHRHEEGFSVASLAGPGDSASRPAERSSVLLPWSSRQPVEGDLARWSGRVPVREALGAGPFLVAELGRRSSDDLVRATRISAVRHRLETSAGDVATNIGGMTVFALQS